MGGYQRYEAYQDSGIEWLGEIPAHWEVKRLKFLATVQPSNVNKKSVEGEQPILLCNYTDVYKNQIIHGNLNFMQATASSVEIRKFIVEKDDVIITKDSESREDIAVPAYVGENVENLVCGYHLTQIKPKYIFGKFLYWLFESSLFNAKFAVSANGVTRFGLPQYSVNNIAFNTPPLEEQKTIARFLDYKTAQIDALIAKKASLLKKLAEKRSALISQAVTKGLDPKVPMKDSGVEWLGEVPAHWKLVPFRWCCRITEGQVDPKKPEFEAMPLVAPNHIESKTGRLLLRETAQEQGAISGKYLYDKGSVLYSKIRPALVKACIADEPGLCSADMYPIAVSAELMPKFLLYQLLSKGFTQFAVLASDRVAMPKVNRETLSAFPIIIPPVADQIKIIAMIDRQIGQLDVSEALVKSAIDRLKEYRTALITNAVTGAIDVRNIPIPDDLQEVA
jgi:type I restriction enzyme, S subunit